MSTAAARADCEIPGDIRVSVKKERERIAYVTVITPGCRPHGWGGRTTSCIFLPTTNYAKLSFLEGNLKSPPRAFPAPRTQLPTDVG